MASDVTITIINSVIVFSCPACKRTGGFPLELIREMKGETINYPCGHCGAAAGFGSARVEGYGGSKGAAEFIITHAKQAILVILDVYLGDGTFMDVLGGIKADEKAANIS